jgi:hypothetical protein
MKTSARNLSIFDAVSTFLVMAVLGSVMALGFAQPASAEDCNTDEDPFCLEISAPEGVEQRDDFNLRQAIIDIINYVLTFLGIIAVAIVIWAGFLLLTSAGNEEQVSSAKSTIIYALIGIVVILISWVLVQFVVQIFNDAGE